MQASAGTGKSFLLTSIYLWCVVHGMACKAAAPTGIAAANIEIDGTDICAATLHSVFDLDGKYESNLDFTKPGFCFVDVHERTHTMMCMLETYNMCENMLKANKSEAFTRC